MTPAPHPRLAEVFARVVDAPAKERETALDRECSGDPSLRQAVESLLAQDARFATPASTVHAIDSLPIVLAAAIEAVLADSSIARGGAGYAKGTVVDHFTIEREVGRGGFGVVYLATQAPPERRAVALKILENMAPRLERRFEEERRAMAKVHHPGIARIYSGGRTAAGHPYFAMEFIAAADGTTPASRITDYADRCRLTVRQRVELFLPVCHAVHDAHQNRVIHRDLKPSNILVEEHDGPVRPKLIDFGIASHVEEESRQDPDALKRMLTLSGEVIGTLAYMSPEQAAGERVDIRTDVYSLGVVLFELLCGVSPLPTFQRDASREEQLRAIREEEPVRPSRAVRMAPNASDSRGTDSRRLVKHLDGDLDTILCRLLEKNPAQRFQSASAIAEDLQRYLSSKPIASRPHTRRYMFSSFARRHRAFVGATVAVLVSLVVTVVSLVVAVVVTRDARDVAQRERQDALLKGALANLRTAEYADLNDDGDAFRRALDDVPEELRAWEWYHLNSQADRSVRRIDDFEASTSALAISADGKRLLVGDRSGTTTTLDASNFLRVWQRVINPKCPGSDDVSVWSVAWSPTGNVFATCSFDNIVRLHAADGSERGKVQYQGPGAVYAVAFNPDGDRLAVGGGDQGRKYPQFVALLDVATQARVWVDNDTHKGRVYDVSFSSDRRWLASSGEDQMVRLWNLDSADPIYERDISAGGIVTTLAFSPDSSLLAAGTEVNEIRLYRVPKLDLVAPLTGHRSPVASVAFHPDGKSLASASWDSTVRVWSAPNGQQLNVLRGHRGRVNRVAFAHDGRLFSASDDETIREWDASRGPSIRSLDLGGGLVSALGVLADGDLAVAFFDKTLRIVESADGTTKAALGQSTARHFTISPDRFTIAWDAADCVKTWRAGRETIAHPHEAFADLRNPLIGALEDQHLVIVGDGGLLTLDRVTNQCTLREKMPPHGFGRRMHHAWLGANDRILATIWVDERGSACRIRDGRTEPLPPGWRPFCHSSGRYAVLAAADGGRDLAVYDNDSAKLVATLEGHRERVLDVAFSPPDDARLATVAEDKTLRIWDWRRGLQVLSIPYPPSDNADPTSRPYFSSVAWSKNGHTLVTGSSNGFVHFWLSR